MHAASGASLPRRGTARGVSGKHVKPRGLPMTIPPHPMFKCAKPPSLAPVPPRTLALRDDPTWPPNSPSLHSYLQLDSPPETRAAAVPPFASDDCSHVGAASLGRPPGIHPSPPSRKHWATHHQPPKNSGRSSLARTPPQGSLPWAQSPRSPKPRPQSSAARPPQTTSSPRRPDVRRQQRARSAPSVDARHQEYHAGGPSLDQQLIEHFPAAEADDEVDENLLASPMPSLPASRVVAAEVRAAARQKWRLLGRRLHGARMQTSADAADGSSARATIKDHSTLWERMLAKRQALAKPRGDADSTCDGSVGAGGAPSTRAREIGASHAPNAEGSSLWRLDHPEQVYDLSQRFDRTLWQRRGRCQAALKEAAHDSSPQSGYCFAARLQELARSRCVFGESVG